MRKFDFKWWGVILAVWLILFVVGWKRLDPDFGWHYAMGKYITEHGKVPKTDPFSYTMSDFYFVDHEWLTNVLMFTVYQKWGMGVLAAICAGMVTLALILMVPNEGRETSLVPILLVAALWISRGGVRPQIEDWLLVVVLVRVFADKKLWRRLRWTIPIFFGLWANLHGGFAIGLGVLAFCVSVRGIEERKLDMGDVLAGILAVAATLINPYGYKLWYEVWMQFTDGNLRGSIAEWLPFFATVEFSFLFLTVLGIMLGWRYRKLIGWWRYGLLVVMCLAGLSALRHVPLYAAVAGPVVIMALGRLKTETLASGGDAEARWRAFWKAMAALSILIFSWEVFWNLLGAVTEGSTGYPAGAVAYLKQNPPARNVMSEYGWGGYLIWKYPEKKVFVDGRMPSWRSPDMVPLGKYLVPDEMPTEGRNKWIFKTYQEMTIKAGSVEDTLDKYNVDTVLWPAPSKKRVWWERINNLLSKWNLTLKQEKPKEEKKDFLTTLKDLGWREIYTDNVSVIYREGN